MEVPQYSYGFYLLIALMYSWSLMVINKLSYLASIRCLTYENFSSKRQQLFLQYVVHDVKTPITDLSISTEWFFCGISKRMCIFRELNHIFPYHPLAHRGVLDKKLQDLNDLMHILSTREDVSRS